MSKQVGVICRTTEMYLYVKNFVLCDARYEGIAFHKIVDFERDCRARVFDYCVVYEDYYRNRDLGAIMYYLQKRGIMVKFDFEIEYIER